MAILQKIEPMVRSTKEILRRMTAEKDRHLARVDEVQGSNEVMVQLRTHEIHTSDAMKQEFERGIRQKLLDGLITHLHERFPDVKLLSALSVLDPHNMPDFFSLLWGRGSCGSS